MKTPKIYGDITIPSIDELSVKKDFYDSACRNAENIIGGVTIPLGVAGLLPIKGVQAQGEYLIPLATTEACLIASVNRGVKIIRQSNGCKTTVRRVGISRAPVFKILNIKSADYYQEFLQKNREKLAKFIAEKSSHLKLIDMEVSVNQSEEELFIHFRFDSADAMGMNMATIATKHLATVFLESALDATLIAVSSNWCSDKKPALIHAKLGRGYWVEASVSISSDSLQETFHCTPESFLQVYHTKIIRGSQLAGSLAKNAHHANIIAAIFAATGQDLAHIVEGSHGETIVEKNDDKIIVTVKIPSLIIGTVGGGTKVLSQHAVLSKILQLKNPAGNGDQAMELAEVIAGAVLAGEISLLGAIAAQNLAESHAQFR